MVDKRLEQGVRFVECVYNDDAIGIYNAFSQNRQIVELVSSENLVLAYGVLIRHSREFARDFYASIQVSTIHRSAKDSVLAQCDISRLISGLSKTDWEGIMKKRRER